MPPADSEVAPAAEAAAVAAGASDGAEEQAAISSVSPTRRHDAEQSASSTVDDASVDDASATGNAEVSDLTTAEPDSADGQLGDVPLPDDADGDAKHSEPPADTEQPSAIVADSRGVPTDEEQCTEKSTNDDDDVFEVKAETDEEKIEECSDVGTRNQEVATATKDDHSVVTNDVVNGDPFAGEISSKDWTAAAVDEWSSKSPVLSFDQADTALAKFDSSALEKILNSLSATSLRDHDGLTNNGCNRDDNDDDDVDDEVWMRHDVVNDDACQSSLSMLDAAAAQLDNGQHFKSRRRRSSSSTSSSTSSSVGHCSPSCLIPHSTVDIDTDTSTPLFFSSVTKASRVETSTDTTHSTSASTTPANLPSTSASLEPAEMETSSQTPG